MNDNNEMVTKGFLRDAFKEAIDSLATLINKSFQAMESRMGKMEADMGTMGTRMGTIEVRMGKMESGMAKQEDLLALVARVGEIERRLDGHDMRFKDIQENFDVVFAELKDIRRQLNRADTRAEVLDLQIRVTKLERKVER